MSSVFSVFTCLPALRAGFVWLREVVQEDRSKFRSGNYLASGFNV